MGDAADQAACLSGVAMTATPSVNVMPVITLGNWFSPFSRRQVREAAMTSVKTINLAVFSDRAPFVRTVRCRTVANTLSMGLAVRKWSQCSAGKSKKVRSAFWSLVRHATALAYLAPYFFMKVSIAVSAAVRFGAAQTSRRSAFMPGCTDLGTLFSRLAILCTQQR